MIYFVVFDIPTALSTSPDGPGYIAENGKPSRKSDGRAAENGFIVATQRKDIHAIRAVALTRENRGSL